MTTSNGEVAWLKIYRKKKTARSGDRRISSMPAESIIENGPPDMIVAATSSGSKDVNGGGISFGDSIGGAGNNICDSSSSKVLTTVASITATAAQGPALGCCSAYLGCCGGPAVAAAK
ncbi:hypothetical protein TIFTF001_030020 [Ficus carica]|uniref:Uncharacterized protein n=1 Tax=Ficus carica TaxID=3494 RepID=A0AA88DSM5_FICCA|nr:hypothetical protein TIFTF001_030020 [Ficus carica]